MANVKFYFSALSGTERRRSPARSSTVQSLGKKFGSKPIIFFLPQEKGTPITYKVDPEKLKLIHDLAEAIKVPDDQQRSSSLQSVPLGSMPSVSCLMQTDDPMTNRGM